MLKISEKFSEPIPFCALPLYLQRSLVNGSLDPFS